MSKNQETLPISTLYDWHEITAKSVDELNAEIKTIPGDGYEIYEIKAVISCKKRE